MVKLILLCIVLFVVGVVMIRYPDVFANIPQAPWDRMSQPSEAEIVIVGILVMIISVALLIYGIVH